MAVNKNLPNWREPIANISDGTISQAWYSFFALLVGSPAAITSVAITSSPMSYTAASDGSLIVSGGTVSSITISRAHVSNINVGFTSGAVPVSGGDTVTITYTVSPTINFVPGA